MQATAAFEVICLPPYSVCRDNWASGRPELIKEEQRLRDTYYLFEDFSATYKFDDFIYDYTKFKDLKDLYWCLDIFLDAERRDAREIIMPTGYIGRHDAKYLFVGDRGSNPRAKHDLPFFANVGSSQYLNECIDEAGFKETEIALVNGWYRTKPLVVEASHPHVSAEIQSNGDVVCWREQALRQFPQVIALGVEAKNCCERQKIEATLVPHPQFWKRFHHNDKQGYVEKLRKCRIS